MKFGNDLYVVALDGLADTRPLEAIPERIKKNAVRAVNYAAGRARTRSAKEMREQVNFPARYLSGNDGRLTLSTAKGFGDQAEITGRFRPTSLARFATRGTPGVPGVSFMVKPGFATRSNRMFLIRLRAGTADLDTKSNLGVAIRLREGETIRNKKVSLQRMGKTGLYLLYGPSVSHVFRSVAGEQVPEVEQDLAREFERLMEAGV
jgi:hypothetical protein